MRIARTLTAGMTVVLLAAPHAGCGSQEGGSGASTTVAKPGDPAREGGTPERGGRAGRAQPEGSGRREPGGRAAQVAPDPRDDEAAKRLELRAATRAYEDYIDAINARDGAALCRLLAPGALRLLHPAVASGDCAHRIGASIGYRDPRGFPVWEKTTLSGFERTAIGRDLRSARLTGAIVTSFADRSEPSVESDVAYLERVDGSWRLAKPTGALYRAIGQADIPPSVISPP